MDSASTLYVDSAFAWFFDDGGNEKLRILARSGMIQRHCQLLILSQCSHQKLLQYSFLGKVALKSVDDIEDEEQVVQGCHIIATACFHLLLTSLFQIAISFQQPSQILLLTVNQLSFNLNMTSMPILFRVPFTCIVLVWVWFTLCLSATALVF